MIPRLFVGLTALVLALAVGPAITQKSFSPTTALAATTMFQTDMHGSEQVPPVRTQAWGFVRWFFNEDRTYADYTVDVKGLSGTLVAGADIHRGRAGVNGPVVRHLADGGFIVTSGNMRFTAADLQEMAAGNWYVSLKSTEFPDGELRGQIVLPAGFLNGAALPVPTPLPLPPPSQQPPVGGQPLPQPTAVCGDMADVTFSWQPVAGNVAQWLDLSLEDDLFADGTFYAAGPFAPNDSSFLWPAIQPGVPVYWRVNALTPFGWVPSATGGFIAC